MWLQQLVLVPYGGREGPFTMQTGNLNGPSQPPYVWFIVEFA